MIRGRSCKYVRQYRYGFNGQEKDDEAKGLGNSLDFVARVYDSRLGRFLSLEPRKKDYPGLSTYSFAGNSCIVLIDKNGEFPWTTGFIGAAVNIAIGYSAAYLNDKDYTLKDAAIDGSIGFVIGSGAALFAPSLGLSNATTLVGKVFQGSIVGMGTGFISNGLNQTLRLGIGDQNEWSGEDFVLSGVGGIFAGGVAAGMGIMAEKFMTKVAEKRIADFTKGELQQYIKIQTKYLKRQIENVTGAKVGHRQLQREVTKAAENWKDLKIIEIESVNYALTKGTEIASGIVVTLGTDQAAKKTNKKK